MPVTPYCNTLFQSRRNLYEFLSVCQQVAIQKNQSQLVSLSIEIDPIDPLVVLDQIAQPHQLSFYFEKQEFSREIGAIQGDCAIAAIGSATHLMVESPQRFASAKHFIQSTLENVITAGDGQLPLSGPHFFCSFSFFDQHSNRGSYFPAATIFLPSWQISRQANRSTVVINSIVHTNINLQQLVEKIWTQLRTIQSIKYNLLHPALDNKALLKQKDVTDPIHFKQAVASVLRSIRSQQFSKVVLAHAVDISSPLPFHLSRSLNNLRTLYPDCYIFAISNGKGQQFVGASPERLIRLHHHSLLTDALAGSTRRGQTECEDAHLANRLLTSTKELHEHQVVVDFIADRLGQLGLTPHLSPLRLLQLSNIQHLHTPIHALVPANVHLLDIVSELHPTPAVAGVPRTIACEHIRRYEAFERSLYAAPIGWIDHQGNGEFAVGIRSALLNGCQARLFAGAGIVAGSDPDRELAEVQLKLQALLTALV